ncbi:MAG TPA: EVE domain-containing protein [Candidatus Methylacidiphilales bacterium]|nr:EVE domain-containing protein [Candidatus Methylacidiphilales bacterium]
MNYWLVKQEPEAYSFAKFQKDGTTAWTGVRNYQARINLNAMKVGDTVFYYHSVTGKAVVGTAEVSRTAYPDTTADEEGWVCVDLKAGIPLDPPYTLAEIKEHETLKDLALVKQSRLSVMPVPAEAAKLFLKRVSTDKKKKMEKKGEAKVEAEPAKSEKPPKSTKTKKHAKAVKSEKPAKAVKSKKQSEK